MTEADTVQQLEARVRALSESNRELRFRLEEAEETLRAIRQGEVDAVVVSSGIQEQIFTLRGADHTYRVIVETMKEAAATVTMDGDILYCNKMLAELLHVPLNGLVGSSFCSYLEADSLAQFMTMLETSGSGRFEVGLAAGDDHRVPVLLSASPLVVDDACLVCIVIMDLSEVRATQQKLQERTTQAEEQAARLRILNSALMHAEQKERRRLAQILHDHLQQLIVSARMHLGLLKRKVRGGDSKAAADHIDQILQESIKVSRSLVVELSPPILHEGGIVPALRWLSGWMREKHGLGVVLEVAEDLQVTSQALRTFLFEAARELLFNVVKHSEVDHCLLTLQKNGRAQVLLRVVDQGVGFEVESFSEESATGLGIAGMRQRLNLVGGTFELSSQPGAGTSVTIGLTDCLDGVESPIMQPADLRRTRRDDQEIGRKGIRVLVVEDHPVTRRGIMQLLSEHVDLDLVGEAGDGQTALAMAALTKPDVVIMDVVMPGMSGIDATRSIKSEHPGITVIGFSMHNEEDVRRRMIQAGASAYVVKDEAVEQLVRTVRGCCPGRQAGSAGLFDSARPSE